MPRLRVTLAELVLTATLMAGSVCANEIEVVNGDGDCPVQDNLVTPQYALANQQALCGMLGTWYVARLAGGGSMDGPGYGCTIRDSDTRKLGQSLCQEQFSDSVQPRRAVTTADMTANNPLPPVDIYRPSGAEGPDHKDLANFAWLEFIALSAPAGMRGVPDGSFVDSGKKPSTTLVWETFQHRSELFPFAEGGGATAPQQWGSSPVYEMKNGANDPEAYTVPYSNFNNLDETSQIGQNFIYFPKSPGSPNPDSDSQILFEAKVNQSEWQYVVDNYQGKLKDTMFGPFRYDPPLSLPENSMEVKVAWRPIESISENQRHRYHTAEVIYFEGSDDNPQAKKGSYAMIGLHIIHKSPNYPTFTFATFEQVDNLTNQVTGKPTGLYYVPVYDAIDYTLPPTTTIPPVSGTVYDNPKITLPDGQAFDIKDPKAAPNGQTVDLPLVPADIEGAKTVLVDGQKQVAVPVTQPPTTNDAVSQANAEVLKAMQAIPGFNKNFVWQYYQLKGVQAVPTGDETAKDYYLANNVIESSQPGVQLFRGGAPNASPQLKNVRNQLNVMDPKQNNAVFSVGGCQGCHGVAQTQNGFDFNFLFFGVNGAGFNPDTIESKAPEAIKALSIKYYKR